MSNPIKAAAFQILLQFVRLTDCCKKENALNKHKFTKSSYFQGRDWELLVAALILCCQYCSGAESLSASVWCFLSSFRLFDHWWLCLPSFVFLELCRADTVLEQPDRNHLQSVTCSRFWLLCQKQQESHMKWLEVKPRITVKSCLWSKLGRDHLSYTVEKSGSLCWPWGPLRKEQFWTDFILTGEIPAFVPWLLHKQNVFLLPQ